MVSKAIAVAATTAALLTLGPLPSPRPSPEARLVRHAPSAITIGGRVLEAATGTPLQGVSVRVDGANLGSLTNAEGRYSILLGDGWRGRTVTVTAQLVGHASATRSLTLSDAAHALDFALVPVAMALDEIVVVKGAAAARMAERAGPAFALSPTVVSVGRAPGDFQREGYAHIEESGFRAVSVEPLSTFSIDVDRASYANVRRFVEDGLRPPVDAVRIEELINYFPYADPEPAGADPFTVNTEVAPAPWQPLHHLVRIGLKARSIDMDEAPANNLVFLLDVSGSMGSPDKLPLLKTALSMLVEELRPQDRVAIVVYAGAAGLVLPSTPGSEKTTILEALHRLQSGGSTAGGAGIRLAYAVAAENHVEGGNNRVILATDGDFNVGASSDAEMVRLIEEKREQGTFLTVLGFGTGNLQDAKMEQIADHGNGNYAYIDGPLEARKTLVAEMGGTLVTVAQDVKIQVEFNPARVAAYRLIGYENRMLAAEDFDDDTKDAGELGAGHTVTALYEVIPVGVDSPAEVRGVAPLRYQRPDRAVSSESDEILFVKVRHQEPGGSQSRLVTRAVRDVDVDTSDDFRFAAAVAAWGMLLRDSEHCAGFTLDDVARLARGSLGPDEHGYRADFLRLVDRARSLELLDLEPGTR